MIYKQTENTIQPEILDEFQQVCQIIDLHTARALSKVNEEHLITCWEIGAFISARVKQGKWGDKVVRALVDYLKQQRPNYRGDGRSNLYNMVRFYETYSSEQFVQSANGQLPEILKGRFSLCTRRMSYLRGWRDVPFGFAVLPSCSSLLCGYRTEVRKAAANPASSTR